MCSSFAAIVATAILLYGGTCRAQSIYASCAHAKAAGETSGVTTIDPDGEGGSLAFRAYCEQDTNGGGWMLVGTRAANTYDGSTNTVSS